jgi:hypothetical protein
VLQGGFAQKLKPPKVPIHVQVAISLAEILQVLIL